VGGIKYLNISLHICAPTYTVKYLNYIISFTSEYTSLCTILLFIVVDGNLYIVFGDSSFVRHTKYGRISFVCKEKMSLSVRSRTCELYTYIRQKRGGRLKKQKNTQVYSYMVHPNTRVILVVITCIILFEQSIELQSGIYIM